MLLPWTYQDVGFGPGTLSYLASLVGLYAVAVRLGQLSGRLDEQQAAGILEAIAASGDDVAATIDGNTHRSSEVAATRTNHGLVCLAGGGPNYATPLFGMPQLIETAASPALAPAL